ncbi:MAG: ribbon-helix-helix protein, CopG family [Geminicoccaceae bacterium]
MVRTQIYLRREQQRSLERLAAATGRRKSDLIRTALDQYLAQQQPKDWFDALEQMFGMWSDRPEMDDHVRRLREEVDARLAERWETPAS